MKRKTFTLFRLSLCLCFLPFYPLSLQTDFHENRNNSKTSLECTDTILFDFLYPVVTKWKIYNILAGAPFVLEAQNDVGNRHWENAKVVWQYFVECKTTTWLKWEILFILLKVKAITLLDEGIERNYTLYGSYCIEVSDYREGKSICVTSNMFKFFGTSASIYIIIHLQNSIKQHKW
jgi:hypothetical protein